MTDVAFDLKEVAYRAGGPLDHVYFPRAGILSAVGLMTCGGRASVGPSSSP